MSFDSIGGNTFIRLSGPLDPQGITVQEITRPGADGNAYRKMGSRGEVTTLDGLTDCLGFNAANSLVVSCKALQGTTTTIVRDGLSYSNMFVLKVIPGRPYAVLSPVGGTCGGNVLQPIQFQVQATSGS